MHNWKRPSFIGSGTFIPDSLGYRYSEAPPLDLLSATALQSDDPWIVLAAVLERAKKGDFRYLPLLEQRIDPRGDPLFGGACFQLWGDVGTEAALRPLLSYINQGPTPYVLRACQACHHAGYLWLAGPILNSLQRLSLPDDRDTIGLILSEMLEEQPGPISAPSDYPEADYRRLVESRVYELRSKLETEFAPVWAGRLFGVRSLAMLMLQTLTSARTESYLYAEFLDLRQRFEASTGINCSSFFAGGRVNGSIAKAVLNEFLKTPESREYVEGVRYFFGHAIPVPRK